VELVALVLAAATLALGVALGYRRRWRTLWVGLALAGVAFLAASLASNDSVSGNSDLSWRTALRWLAVILLVAFYAGVVLGAITAWTRRTQAGIDSPSR
jgi:phosphatidylserine synthase